MPMSNSENKSQANKVWLITGASSGLGLFLAEYLAAAGANVVATARKPEHLKDLAAKYPAYVHALQLDVTNQPSVDSAVKDAIAHFGHIDVLVNNAGYGTVGAIEEHAEEEFRPMFETNVFGLIRVTNAVLPHMRERKSGHILNLSSIGGLVASPGFGMYNGTKFAVEGISESQAQELAPLGIKLTIIEPGPFRTDFLGRSGVRVKNHIDDYDASSGKMRAYFESMNGKQPGDPVKAAAAMVAVVDSPNPPLRLLLGGMTIPRLRGKIDAMQKEVSEWESTTAGADFPAGT
jgi:NADP-dependent 3-hydroxy acid dehydrogenase YdfG